MNWRQFAAPLLLLLLAVLQLSFFARDIAPGASSGRWFLYGSDTLTHDAIVHQWVQGGMAERPLAIPLWMPGIQGGLPTVGAFLWTPFAPQAWAFHFLEYPEAQRLAWMLCLWLGAWGAYVLGRMHRLSVAAALVTGLVWGFSGHVVTLIHAGHFQKVMALSWLPWMAAGAVMLNRAGALRNAWRGSVLLAAGFGLMLLAGHPQIAYTGALIAGGLTLWEPLLRRRARRFLPRAAVLLAAGIVLGLLLSAAQFLPGTETARLSTRAAGITFEEATATSYPPAEVLEFAVPLHKGSSVTGADYTGEWGERIVSDYIGKLALALAFLSLFGGIPRTPRTFFWLAAAAFFLAVGFGSHTPLYGLLYKYLPAFDGFRSPGTFMAGTSLALAMLAGLGFEAVRGWLRHARKPRLAGVFLLVLAAAQAGDVMRANRHFLLAFSWEQYEFDFLAPRPLDTALADRGLLLQTHDMVSELSLRPLLFGGRPINGYHPITYMEKQRLDEFHGLHSDGWLRGWGITHVLAPLGAGGGEGVSHAGDFPVSGRTLLALPGAIPHVHTEPVAEYEWRERSGQARRLLVETEAGTYLRVHDVSGPGTVVVLNGEPAAQVAGLPEMFTEMDLPPGRHEVTWLYRPDSHRVGLFLTALGAMLAAAVLSGTRRRRESA